MENEDFKIKGRVIEVLPIQSGASLRGEWKRRYLIIETEGSYSKTIPLVLIGSKADSAGKLSQGDLITVYFSIQAREVYGKWITDLKAYRWEVCQNGEKEEIEYQVKSNL